MVNVGQMNNPKTIKRLRQLCQLNRMVLDG
jgi:hypothetical protein